jgi:multiple sugar transport system permease protein
VRLRTARRLPSSRSLLVSAVLLALAIPLVFPLYWMVSSSFKGTHETFAYPPVIVPEALRLDNFQQVFELQPFALQYANSLYIAVLNVAGTMILASLSGYAFARIRFPGRNLIFVLFLAALLMPLEVLIIPLYIIMRDLGWSRWWGRRPWWPRS